MESLSGGLRGLKSLIPNSLVWSRLYARVRRSVQERKVAMHARRRSSRGGTARPSDTCNHPTRRISTERRLLSIARWCRCQTQRYLADWSGLFKYIWSRGSERDLWVRKGTSLFGIYRTSVSKVCSLFVMYVYRWLGVYRLYDLHIETPATFRQPSLMFESESYKLDEIWYSRRQPRFQRVVRYIPNRLQHFCSRVMAWADILLSYMISWYCRTRCN